MAKDSIPIVMESEEEKEQSDDEILDLAENSNLNRIASTNLQNDEKESEDE